MKKITIAVDPAIEALVEEWLWIKDALSVSLPAPHEARRQVEALFEEMDEEAFLVELAGAAEHWDGEFLGVHFDTVDEQAWQTSWRDNFQPLEIGSFKLVGEWEEPEENPHTIRIYPGQAFGTGQHETTQLIIERMEELDLKGKHVLDVGCGTGILSIVAERLGAERVVGFDVDPDARENMDRHLSINNCVRVCLNIGTLETQTAATYQLILANITLNVLLETWPKIGAFLDTGGTLLNSGILVTQKDEAVAALANCGFEVTAVREKGEWVMIEAVRS